MQKIIREGYDDPITIHEGDEFDRVEGMCGICFGKIVQPVLAGIWYHKERYYIQDKDHAPVPASTILQLFYFLTKPVSFTNHLHRTKKCKCTRHWNQLLDIPKRKEGVYQGHYFMPNHISLCGRLLDLKHRNNESNEYFPKSSSTTLCKNCMNKLEKLKIIKINYSRGYGYSSYRPYTIEWLSKRVPNGH